MHSLPTLPPAMTSLRSYESLEDAWQGGVANWCRAATRHVLGGGRAWMITVSDGQANWIKRRLLSEGVSLFGIQFFNAASLRNAFCLRRGLHPPAPSKDTLKLILRLRALERLEGHAEITSVARHPGACLAALEDFAAADWLEDAPQWRHDILPPLLDDWLAELRGSGDWSPAIDRQLLDGPAAAGGPPLALCVFGWDASFWPSFNLLVAAADEAQSAWVFAPSPRGSSLEVQMEWQMALEEHFAGVFEVCPSMGFLSAHGDMIGRLEGTDLISDDSRSASPELLVGLDVDDATVLTRDFVARWLDAHPAPDTCPDGDDLPRLVILSPRRDLSAVALLRALAAAGIDVEDEIGEVPEPSLAVQLQRAILAYHHDKADMEGLLGIVELLNEHVGVWDGQDASRLRAVFPLDVAEVRRVLHSAFGEVQHHSVRVLRDVFARSRSEAARPLRRLVDHLGHWPELIDWSDALGRWQRCLEGLGLSTELLEPLWSQLQRLAIHAPVPSAVFFQFLGGVLECAPARRSPDGMHRYARVVLTTLSGAIGQTWGAALFLDSNEGAWPLYPDENAFLDDSLRTRLNQRRAEYSDSPDAPWRGYLLTSSDLAQLEHFRFMEILDNCTGPVAFAGLARDPAEPGKELYANEWALRCLLETGQPLAEGEKLLDRWHEAIRRTKRSAAALPRAERVHLRTIFDARRDADAAFDEYGFNFEGLTSPDELPWTDAWSVRDLETAWTHPATFALKQIFGVSSGQAEGRELLRGEGWMVGRLVHQWVPAALGGGFEPREMTPRDWQAALDEGLAAARRGTEAVLNEALGGGAAGATDSALPLWWRSTLRKADWAARRCLEGLAATAADGQAGWLTLNRRFHGDVGTATGLLRLQASCDVVLSSAPLLDAASCQMIDLRTGSAAARSPTAGSFEQGQGLNLAALMSLALREGALPGQTRVGIVHPDVVHPDLLPAAAVGAAAFALERLAQQQRSLHFGQGVAAGAQRDGETLPFATVPIDPSVLARKLARGTGT